MKPFRLNPSSAHTWTTCTAQPLYLEQMKPHLPKDTDTVYNKEGTVAHNVAEYTLLDKPLPPVKDKWWDGFGGRRDEMVRHAEGFTKFCRELQKGSTRWWAERKEPVFYSPTQNGKIDYSAFPTPEEIVITDYKYGQGVAVSAFENLQMAIYAVSLVQAECGIFNPFNKVTMAIYQPRVRQGEPITTWTLSYGELCQFVEERISIPAADIQARALTLKFAPDSHVCQFCPAKGFCGLDDPKYKPDFPYSGKLRAEALLDDTPLAPLRKGLPASLQKPQELGHDVLTKLVLRKGDIAKFLKDAEEYAEDRLKEGVPVKGLKLVQGKGGHRKWRNEDDAKIFLLAHCPREEVIEESLISPTQADKFEHDLPKDEWQALQTLVFKPEGGPQVVSERDPRPVYGISKAAEYFEDDEWI